MKHNFNLINKYYKELEQLNRENLNKAIDKIIEAKKKNGKVMVVTGSGPNIHEGITILISELMDKNIVNSVSTSSAVIAHEMAGSLDKVKRVPAHTLGIEIDKDILPRGDIFEFTQLKKNDLEKLQEELILDEELLKKSKNVDGDIIIKAAGNMAYPMGLRTEILSREILNIAQTYNLPFEEVAGWGADERTMIGKGAEKGFPVIVTVPQLVGGGAVGLSIGDSISISERSMRIARILEESEVIIESAVALTQEIHDGPFECYTGHGIWSNWIGMNTFSLKEKTIIRIDLDKQLMQAKLMENENKKIQEAINKGLPKTKITGIPFRMEMSAFARHEKSIPIVGDIGKIWPIIASKVADGLGISLDFISYPQESEEGKRMREWIVENVKPVDRRKLLERSKRYKL
jgi:organic radical activating enzyme